MSPGQSVTHVARPYTSVAAVALRAADSGPPVRVGSFQGDMNESIVSKQSTPPNFANLKLIVYSMLGGVTLFAVVALYLVESARFTADAGLGPVFAGIIIGLVLTALVLGRIASRRLRSLRRSGAADQRMQGVRSFVTRTIAQAATVEFISFVGTGFYLGSGQFGLLAVPLAGSYLLARLAKVDRRFEQFRSRRAGLIA